MAVRPTSALGPGRLMFVTDKATGTQFLVDTGAEVSVIPPSAGDQPVKLSLRLKAANGSTIRFFGHKTLTLDLGLSRPLQWDFIIADVTTSIIGIDFLTYFNLTVDIPNHRIIDANTNTSVSGVLKHAEVTRLSVVSPTADPRYLRLFKEFSQLVRQSGDVPSVADSVAHHIVTRGPPVAARPRRLAPDKLASAKAEFARSFVSLVQLGLHHCIWYPRKTQVNGVCVGTTEP